MNLPDNAIGVYSSDNDNPLQHRYDRESYRVFDITSRSDTNLVLTAREATTVIAAVYLGAIVSPNGNVVYWTNNSKPLP